MKIAWMLALVILMDTSGNLLLSHGMKQIGKVTLHRLSDLFRMIPRVLSRPAIGLAVGCMTVSFFSFLTLLSWANLSFVLPATALGYCFNTLGAVFILKETVTAERWLGTLLIGLGVALVSL